MLEFYCGRMDGRDKQMFAPNFTCVFPYEAWETNHKWVVIFAHLSWNVAAPRFQIWNPGRLEAQYSCTTHLCTGYQTETKKDPTLQTGLKISTLFEMDPCMLQRCLMKQNYTIFESFTEFVKGRNEWGMEISAYENTNRIFVQCKQVDMNPPTVSMRGPSGSL